MEQFNTRLVQCFLFVCFFPVNNIYTLFFHVIIFLNIHMLFVVFSFFSEYHVFKISHEVKYVKYVGIYNLRYNRLYISSFLELSLGLRKRNSCRFQCICGWQQHFLRYFRYLPRFYCMYYWILYFLRHLTIESCLSYCHRWEEHSLWQASYWQVNSQCCHLLISQITET